MLVGLWVGSNHPHMHQFLGPLVQQMEDLEKRVIMINKQNKSLHIRATVIAFILELAAKV